MQIDIFKIEYTGKDWSELKKSIFANIQPNSFIIDVGCKHGSWLKKALSYIPENVVNSVIKIGIDPIDYGERTRNVSYDLYEEAAIGLEDKESVCFYTLNESGCNSLLKPTNLLLETSFDGQKRKETGIINVQQKRLDSILLKYEPSNIHYLKTDCQGADLNAIKSMGNLLKITKFIEMEIGLDKNKPFYEQSDEFSVVLKELELLGFEPIEFTNFPVSPLPEGELVFKRKK